MIDLTAVASKTKMVVDGVRKTCDGPPSFNPPEWLQIKTCVKNTFFHIPVDSSPPVKHDRTGRVRSNTFGPTDCPDYSHSGNVVNATVAPGKTLLVLEPSPMAKTLQRRGLMESVVTRDDSFVKFSRSNSLTLLPTEENLHERRREAAQLGAIFFRPNLASPAVKSLASPSSSTDVQTPLRLPPARTSDFPSTPFSSDLLPTPQMMVSPQKKPNNLPSPFRWADDSPISPMTPMTPTPMGAYDFVGFSNFSNNLWSMDTKQSLGSFLGTMFRDQVPTPNFTDLMSEANSTNWDRRSPPPPPPPSSPFTDASHSMSRVDADDVATILKAISPVAFPSSNLERVAQAVDLLAMIRSSSTQQKSWPEPVPPSNRVPEFLPPSRRWPATPDESALSPSGQQPVEGTKSAGSALHPNECRPCAFYWTKGCMNGADCRFCHKWHPPKKKKPMKEQKNLMIIARPDGKIEFMRCTIQEALRVW